MNKKKILDYESPVTQLIELRVESGILTVSGQKNTIDDAIEDKWGTL